MNIVAFGCSFTVGEGLDDVFPQFNKISKFAWPQQLADLANCTVTNLGVCGASCKEILHMLLNHKFNKGDIVVVCWSFIDRWCIIKDDDEIYQFGIWNTEKGRLLSGWSEQTLQGGLSKIATAFYEHIHDDEDRIQEMLRDIEFARLYLDSKGIKNYHMSVGKDAIIEKNWFKTKILDIDWQSQDKAPDKVHPGIQTHKIVAQKIFELTQGFQL